MTAGRSTLLAALAGALGLVACTSGGLQPIVPPPPAVADDLLDVQVHLCTSVAKDAFFPVKILFVVDTSDSMSVTDRGATRSKAVVDVLNRYAGNPSVSFAVMAFDSKLDVLTPGFTSSPDIPAISARLTQADRLTDYQGALGTAYQLLSQDMQNAPPADRPRTKYVVIFLTDGTPDPQCNANGVSADLVCTVPKMMWQTYFDPPLDPSLYPDLIAGGDYNQPAQIYQKVDQIVALQDFFHVGEVRLHTAFLFPTNLSDALLMPFHLDRMLGETLLTQMAMHGGGTFTEFNDSSTIQFLNIDYAAVKAPFARANFIVSNGSAVPSLPHPLADSDGDGLADEEEYKLRTCVHVGAGDAGCADPTDTDGDGYTDLVEARNLRAGFDPVDPTKPLQRCPAALRVDTDGDGLRDCEEGVLRTNDRLFDTDADRIPDAVEVRFGMDPLDPTDAEADPDHDLVRSIDEIAQHTDPLVADQPGAGISDVRYGYDVLATTAMPGDSTCYDMEVHGIHLLDDTEGATASAPPGRNRVWLSFIEALKDQPLDYGTLRQACIDVRYVGGGAFKSPASGKVTLTDKQFLPAGRLDPAKDCVNLMAQIAGDAGQPTDGGVDGAHP